MFFCIKKIPHIIVLLVLSSCRMPQVMGLSQEEALRHLENGNIEFILEEELPEDIPAAISHLQPLSRLHPQATFFSGLLVEAGGTAPMKKDLLFALALDSPSTITQREAGAKLISPVLEREEDFAQEVLRLLGNRRIDDEVLASLQGASLYRLGRFDEAIRALENQEGHWNTALFLLSRWNLGDQRQNSVFRWQIVAFFLNFPVNSAWEWALRELWETDLFSPVEEAAILGRAAVARSAFNQALNFFRPIYSENEAFFFLYPELTRDLGRAFMSSPAARREGIDLFTAWEDLIETDAEALQYLLPYYIGRIERQLGQLQSSNEAFFRAHLFAPDALQKDACIWYILMNGLQDNLETALTLLKSYIPHMNSFAYFRSILDRLSQNLVSRRDWKSIEEIFIRLRAEENGGGAAAPFAWVLGRAIEENLFDSDINAEEYFKFIYDERNASIYHRAMSAWRLGLTLIPEFEQSPETERRNTQLRAEMEFLQGFFNFGAAALANSFIRNYEIQLSLPELRSLAASLSEADRIADSLNLITRYMNREDLWVSEANDTRKFFPLSREDLLLFYPRPFQEIIERSAMEAGLGPELLFAIIRTESFFMHEVMSHAGAIGLSQLMPATAMDMAGRMTRQGRPDYRVNGEIDLTNPEINVHIGSFYLDYLFDLMGTPMTAILAYNGGLGRVRQWRTAEATLPEDLFLETVIFEETREYGRRVLAAAAIYAYLYYGLSIEEVVADIYR